MLSSWSNPWDPRTLAESDKGRSGSSRRGNLLDLADEGGQEVLLRDTRIVPGDLDVVRDYFRPWHRETR